MVLEYIIIVAEPVFTGQVPLTHYEWALVDTKLKHVAKLDVEAYLPLILHEWTLYFIFPWVLGELSEDMDFDSGAALEDKFSIHQIMRFK